MNKFVELIAKSKLLILLFVLSFLIRFIFIFEDMPFITHPDEPTVVNSTLNLRYDLNPKHFDWPHFYYYINYLFFSILFLLERVFNRVGTPFPEIVSIENFYLLSRIVTCVFGSLSVVFMYKLVINISKRHDVSLLASVILSILPFHITRSAQTLTDVPMVFFIIVSLYYLSKNIDGYNWKNIYLSSFFVGLAVSTKYNAYMLSLSVLLFVIIFHFIPHLRTFKFKDIKGYLLSGISATTGFLLGTPYALFDFKTFIRDDGPKGALWQFKNVGSIGFFDQIPAFFNNLGVSLLPDFAFIPWILALVFIVYFFYQYRFKFEDSYSKFILILIIQFFFVIWSVSGVKIQRSHYFMAVYALVPIFVSLLISKNEKIKYATLLLTGVLSLYLLAFNFSSNSRIEFYERVVFQNDKKNYNILYSDSELKEVLKKLNVKSDEFDPGMLDFNSRYYTHIISSQNLCPGVNNCNYILINQVVNKEKGNDLFIYEIKK